MLHRSRNNISAIELDETVHVTSFTYSYRLSKVCSEDSHETINWLELKHAVEKKVFLPCKF